MASPEQRDFSKQHPPHGMEPYDVASPVDLGALGDEQQEKLNNFKVRQLNMKAWSDSAVASATAVTR